MEIRKRITLCLLLLFSLPQLFCQEADEVVTNEQTDILSDEELHEETDYELQETEEGEIDFVQKFNWDEMDYVLKYVFTLEQWVVPEPVKADKKTKAEVKEETVPEEPVNMEPHWEQIELIETQANEVDISLKAGKYRYQIAVYNLLGAEELATEWEEVEIIKAYQPVLKDVSPAIIYLEEPQSGIFTLEGIELRENAKIYFKGSKSLFRIKAEIIELDEKNKKIKVKVNPDLLNTQQYTVVIINEGGLKSQFEPVVVKYRKPVDFDVSAGYSCMINLLDSTLKDSFNQRIWPVGADAKISLIPFKNKWGYLGMGVSGSYTLMTKKINSYRITGSLISAYAMGIYQLPIRVATEKENTTRHLLTLEAHGGAGLTIFNNFYFKFPHNIKTNPLNSVNLSAIAGGAVQVYLTNRLYTEINVDATWTFCKDMQMINVVPAINIGYQL